MILPVPQKVGFPWFAERLVTLQKWGVTVWIGLGYLKTASNGELSKARNELYGKRTIIRALN
jgi:hypothetical protein